MGLELHELKGGEGHPLLLVHALFGSSADWAEAPAAWPGAVCALDMSGHGRSDWVRGGAYYPELLAADIDAALARIGPVCLAGAGFGAYASLLVAGARHDLVRGVLLLPGTGLAGGGPQPDFATPSGRPDELAADTRGPFDPMVRTLERDVRPPEFAVAVARPIRRILLLEDGDPRPPWWEAVRALPASEHIEGDVRSALLHLRAATSIV